MSSPSLPPLSQRGRSYIGPIVLILLGVIFLLITMGKLSWFSFGDWFSRYWPLLLILWGAIKLYEYFDAQKQGVRPPRIGVGGVFLVILLVMFGMATQGARQIPWGDLRDKFEIDGEHPFMGPSFDYTDEFTQDFPAGAMLRIDSQRGTINVSPSQDNKLHVIVRKKIGASSQSDGDKLNAQSKPQITGSGNSFVLSANNSNGWVQSNLEVSLPRKGALVLATRNGDIVVAGREGDVQINNEHGDVTVNDVAGKVSVHGHAGSVRVSHLQGDVDADGNINQIELSDITGRAQISVALDEIHLNNVTKGASFRSARTDLEIGGVSGNVTVDSGELHGHSIQGPIRLITRSKNIDLTDVRGDVKIENSNGNVHLGLSGSPSGSIDVQNRDSDIRIEVPEKSGYKVDAHTRNDDIT